MNLEIQKIKKIICKIINIDDVDVQDSLFDKGVDSINMLYILYDIEVEFDIRIPDDQLLITNFETVEQIYRLVSVLTTKESKKNND